MFELKQLYYCKGNSSLHGFYICNDVITFFDSVYLRYWKKLLLNFTTSIKTIILCKLTKTYLCD